MFVNNLRIDRFGAVADLEIDDLTAGLTLIYGPGGTGKATIVGFLRAMLFGFDEASRARYLPADSRGFGGAITITGAHGRQTISRHDDGSFDGRVTIEHDDGRVIGRTHVQELLAEVSPNLFDRLFAVDFSQRPDVSGLLDEAHARGFPLTRSAGDLNRRRELQTMIDRHQMALGSTPQVKTPIESLRQQQSTLYNEIGALEARVARYHDSDAKRRETDLQQLERQLGEAKRELRSLDSTLEECKAQHGNYRLRLEAATTSSGSGQNDARLQELADQIERWECILREVGERQRELAATNRWQPSGSHSPGVHHHPAQHLHTIKTRIDELQAQLDRHDTAGWHQSEWAANLDDMRSSVRQLGLDLAASHADGPQGRCTCAQNQLARCHAELQQAIWALQNEKDALAREEHGAAEAAESGWIEQKLHELQAKTDGLNRRRVAVVATIERAESALNELRQEQVGTAQDSRGVTERLRRKRAELVAVEQDLRNLDRRLEIQSAIAKLEHEIRRLEGQVHDSSILADASAYLQRLSSGQHQEFEVTGGRHLWVVEQSGHRLSWGDLDEASRDQVYLSLGLSLVAAHRRRGITLPLVIKSVFTNFDSREVPEAAEVLHDFAKQGYQVLLLTRHEHVAGVFRLRNTPLRNLHPRVTRLPRIVERPAVPRTLPKQAQAALSAVLDRHWNAEEFPGELTDRVRLVGRSNDKHLHPDTNAAVYYRSENSPIEEAPGVDPANAVRLRKIGVLTVGDLLEVLAADSASELRYAGVTVDMVRNWQAQALLVCRVPRLRPYDARILVACGITTPEQLSRIEPAEVRAMVQRFAASSHGQTLLLSGTEFELSRVSDWIHSVGGSTSRHDGDSDEPSQQQSRQEHGERSRSSRSRHKNRTSSSRSQRHKRTSSSRTQHAPKTGSSHRRRPTSATSDDKPEHQDVVHISQDTNWRFYLESTDPVVDAPSIGPRTASRLEQIGVTTVADLLNADAESVAQQLKHRRINGQTIREWQQQANLAYRVPELRGHDAQILVALGTTDPETLAQTAPQDLWQKVEPFVESTQGRRIIRNGKSPDFEEVFNWIQWAKAARTQKAA